jgi:hypothetical protein
MAMRTHGARAAALAIELLQGGQGLDAYAREVALIRAGRFYTLVPWLDGVLAQELARHGRTSEALARLEGAIETSQSSTHGWWLAELMRMRAELLDRMDPESPAALEAIQAAYSLAREQGALTLARRAGVSWVRLARETGDAARARAALRSTLDLMPEGIGEVEQMAAMKYV